MNDRLRVDTDGLRRASGKYDGAATEVSTTAATLRGILDRYPRAFGTDSGGTAAFDNFSRSMKGVADSIDAVTSRVEYARDGLRTSAKAYDTAEDHAEEAARKLAG